MLKVKDKAPDFSLYDQDNVLHTLSSYKGKKVIIYFYPKDNTSGCTTQACSYRDYYKEFKNKGIVLLGISKDSIKSHQNFKSKYNLPFPLLSDVNREVLEKYDLIKEKTMYGKKVKGTRRSSFLIDEDGYILLANYDVKADEDAENILNYLNNH